jgi:TetR/AcrR family transcriptional repressor of mexJK operon
MSAPDTILDQPASDEPCLDDSICGKAAQIVAAARAAFLEQGYDAISMDEVARRASVAKQTVYAHFAGKQALFLAVVKGEQRRMKIAVPDFAEAGKAPIRETLFNIARQYLESALDPTTLCVFRLAVAEANRFPALGHSICESGPKQSAVTLAGFLDCATRSAALSVEDSAVAAEHFMALVRGDLHIHCLLDPSFRPSPAQITRQLDAALDCFLARYGD